jgi:hypothetical protein
MTMRANPDCESDRFDKVCPDAGGWYGLSLEMNSSPGSNKTSLTRSSVDTESGASGRRPSSVDDAEPISPEPEKTRSGRSLGRNLLSRNRSSDLPAIRSPGLEQEGGAGYSLSKKPKKGLSNRGKTKKKPIPLPSNLFSTSTKEDTDRELSNSPGRFLGRLFAKSEHTSKGSTKSQEKEEKFELIVTLQTENENLRKESKRLRKRLAKKSSAAKELEETQHFAAAAQQPSLEQTELQLDCYEKIIEAKDKALTNSKMKNREQEKRIAYLEVICLQNGIEIEDGIVEKLQKAANIVSNNSSTTGNMGDNSCSTYASFFGESCNEFGDDDEIWEEDLKDHHEDDGSKNNKNDLGSALRRLPGSSTHEDDFVQKSDHSVISEAVASLALEDLVPKSTSPINTKKKDSDSWLNLEVDPSKTSRHSKESSSAHSSSNSHPSFRIPEDASITEDMLGLEDVTVPAEDVNKKVVIHDILLGGHKDGTERSCSPKATTGAKNAVEKNSRHSPTRRSPRRPSNEKCRAGTRPLHQGRTSPEERRSRRNKDTAAVLNALEKSLGASMEFEAVDLPLPPQRRVSA